MAFESLFANKTRSFLSMLGIIIGVATVIAVFAIGQGAQESVNAQFQNLSANSIMVMPQRGRGMTGSSKLKTADAQVIKEKSQLVASAAGAIMGNSSVSYGSNEKSYSVIGVDDSYLAISNLEVVSGRAISAEDISTKAAVAVVGNTVVKNLFTDGTDPVGSTIVVGSKRVQVIGVLAELGSRLGPLSVDEAVIVPDSFAQKSLFGSRGQIMINIQAKTVDDVVLATEEITSILRTEHKLKTTQENDFSIMDAGSMVSAAQESATTMKILLTAIAAITLLVSGIGIMNVMFVTVAERTKEIGIAKAIGGKQSDVLSQFLLESVILSMVGGGIGLIIGQSSIPIITYFNLMTMASSWTGPLIGFTFSILVGITFGFYPAYKASRLDPVDALRSE